MYICSASSPPFAHQQVFFRDFSNSTAFPVPILAFEVRLVA